MLIILAVFYPSSPIELAVLPQVSIHVPSMFILVDQQRVE